MSISKDNSNSIIDEFALVIRSLISTVGDITSLEDAKSAAASQGRHEQMDGFLKEEQACILKLRGLEQRRQSLAKGLGWEGLTFHQILEKSDAGLREVLLPLFTQLDQQVKQLADAKDSADRIIQLRLREFSFILSSEAFQEYNRNGETAAGKLPNFHDRYV